MKISIKYKLFLYFFIPLLVIFTAYAIFTLNKNTSLLEEFVEKDVTTAVELQTELIKNSIKRIEQNINHFVKKRLNSNYTEETFSDLTRNILKTSNPVYSVYIFQIRDYNQKTGDAFYYKLDNYETQFVKRKIEDINKDSYHKIIDMAADHENPFWTEPYFSDSTKTRGRVAYVLKKEFKDRDNIIVITQIRLEELNNAIRIKVDSTHSSNYGLLTSNGTFISSINPNHLAKNIFSLKIFSDDMTAVLKKTLTSKGSGIFEAELVTKDDTQWIFYSHIKSTNWTFFLNLNKSELFAKQHKFVINSIYFFAIVFVLSFFLFLIMTGQFTKPIKLLTKKSAQIASGDFGEEIEIKNHDELGDLAKEFNVMSRELKAREDELVTINKELEDRVIRRTTELAERNKYITDSIVYAKRIQSAILPDANFFNKLFPNHFIIYKPKDVVGGDIYWVSQVNNKKIVTAIDCTGHGVPGAFMSMIGNTLLNEIVNIKKVTSPDEILNQMDARIIEELKKDINPDLIDGMDMNICTIDEQNKVVEFASAYRPLYYFSNNKFFEIKGDRKSIGDYKKVERKFTKHTIETDDSFIFYLFTDGFVDQNDENNKKFGSRRLRETLADLQTLDFNTQKSKIIAILEEHKRAEIQRDDITLLGIKL